jgi:hypothetical protein
MTPALICGMSKRQTQGPSTPVSRAGENAREPSSAQDDTAYTAIEVE